MNDMSGKKFWIRDKRKWTRPRLKRFYLSLLPRIRAVARQSGYAIGVHGSCSRDLDLIAAPWTKKAVEPMTLAIRFSKEFSKYWKGRKAFESEGFGGKPHGRKCFVIYLGCHGDGTRTPAAIYLDLSVVPKA